MKLDPGMHIGMHLVFFGKAGVTTIHQENHEITIREKPPIYRCARSMLTVGGRR
jgi:hypothetical protein